MPDTELTGLLRRVRADQAIIIELLDAGMGTPEIAEACRRIDATLREIEAAVATVTG